VVSLAINVSAAGLLSNFALSTAQALLAMAGAGAVLLRTWAVLVGKPENEIRWWTAFGSAVGLGLMILFVLVDLALEGG